MRLERVRGCKGGAVHGENAFILSFMLGWGRLASGFLLERIIHLRFLPESLSEG